MCFSMYVLYHLCWWGDRATTTSTVYTEALLTVATDWGDWSVGCERPTLGSRYGTGRTLQQKANVLLIFVGILKNCFLVSIRMDRSQTPLCSGCYALVLTSWGPAPLCCSMHDALLVQPHFALPWWPASIPLWCTMPHFSSTRLHCTLPWRSSGPATLCFPFSRVCCIDFNTLVFGCSHSAPGSHHFAFCYLFGNLVICRLQLL